nr:MAG TPA: hypothetical protein [Caudoviricetes sp.]
MEYILMFMPFGLMFWLAWSILKDESKVSLSDISDNALIDYNNADKIVLTMLESSKSGKKSVKFKISYPSQNAYMKNIEYIKEVIEDNFTDDIKFDVEALEYNGAVEVTITTSWE